MGGGRLLCGAAFGASLKNSLCRFTEGVVARLFSLLPD